MSIEGQSEGKTGVQILVLSCFFLLPFIALRICEWRVLGLETKPLPVIIFLVVSIPLFFNRKFLRSLKETVSINLNLIAAYFLLSISYLISLLWSEDLIAGKDIVIKNFVYLLFFPLLITHLISFFAVKKFPEKLLTAIFLGLVVYILYIASAYLHLDMTVFGEVKKSIIVENISQFEETLNSVLKKFAIHICGEENVERKVFNRNMSGYSFLLFALFFNMFLSVKNRINGFILFLLNFFFLFAVIMLQSRGALILLSLLYVTLILSYFYKYRKKKNILLIGFIAFFCISIVSVTTYKKSFSSFFQRLLNTEITKEPRYYTYNKAIEEIEKKPMIGFGAGKKIPISPTYPKRTYVHNLILGSWLMSGILGLLFSISFIFVYLRTTFLRIKSSIDYKKFSITEVLIISIFPLYPLLHFLIGGNNGNPDGITWIFLASFFALTDPRILKNKAKD